MNWGMGMALGKAIQGAGDTWGTERLDLRRKLDKDARDVESHGMQMDQGRASIAATEASTASAQQQLETAKKIDPLRVQQLEQGLQTGKITNEKVQMELDAITRKTAGELAAGGGVSGQFEANLASNALKQSNLGVEQTTQAIQASKDATSIARQNANTQAASVAAQTAASQGATARAEADQKIQNAIQSPFAIAEKQVEPDVRRFATSIGQANKAWLGNYRQNVDPLGNVTKTSTNKAIEDDAGYRGFANQVDQLSQLLAKSVIDHYESNNATIGGGTQHWSSPTNPDGTNAHRDGKIAELARKYRLLLIQGASPADLPGVAGATGGAPAAAPAGGAASNFGMD